MLSLKSILKGNIFIRVLKEEHVEVFSKIIDVKFLCRRVRDGGEGERGVL